MLFRSGALDSKANIIDGAGEKHPLPWTAVTRGGPTTLLDGNHQEIAVMHEAAAQLIVMAVEFYAETFGTNTGEDEE